MTRLSSVLGAVLAALVLAAASAAQDRPTVVVTPGSARSFKIAVQNFADRSAVPEPARASRFRQEIDAALAFSGIFETLSHAAFLGPETSVALQGGEPVVCPDWTQIGADALLQGEMKLDTQLSVEIRLWDVARCTQVSRKRYGQPASADPVVMARRIADDAVASFIGVRGVSSTELTFISDRGGNAEVWVMGAEGSNQRRATSNGSINAFPSWSPDGDAIIYTSYRHRNRPLLFLSTRGRGRPGRLLKQLSTEASEYRGVFAPVGDRVAIVMSEPEKAAEIYTSRPDGSRLRTLTRSRAIDIAPAWSPDGRQIAFVSDRSGSPQIYLMAADGQNQRRLTFNGSYNAHPAWSPDGRWIAYQARVGGQFDIWLIDPEGATNFPLITHPRSDEEPTWAPNSRKLAFSSTRRGRADIYVVDASGDNLRRLTQGAGDNTSPSWGPFPR